jgi:sugar lactone lactonase YvrE
VYGWAVLRITPDGTVDRRIDLPVEKPTMPAFGGGAMRTLFVTSIGEGSSYPRTPGQRDAGGLFAIETGCGGLSEPRFGVAR